MTLRRKSQPITGFPGAIQPLQDGVLQLKVDKINSERPSNEPRTFSLKYPAYPTKVRKRN